MSTQTITRKALASIYPKVCDSWQKKIIELVLFQYGQTIEVDNDLVMQAYEAGDTAQKSFLKENFKIVSNNIEDLIKDLKDVYKHLKVKREDVIPYPKPKNKLQKQLNAVVDINHISLALNGNWIPKFDGTQYNYYPWFKRNGSGGWGFHVFCYGRGVVAGMGSGFYFKTDKLATYAGQVFIEVYKDYLPD